MPRLVVAFVLGLGVSIPAPGLLAQENGALDPEVVLEDLVAAYRAGPTTDLVVVRAQNEARTQEATVQIAVDPQGWALLELGEIQIWVGPDRLCVLNTNDERGYYETARGDEGIIEALRSVVPPLPLPQLALAFDPRPATEIELMEYAEGVQWTEAFLDAGVDQRDLELDQSDEDEDSDADTRPRDLDAPPVVVLRGESARTRVTVEMDPETSRLRRMEVVVDEGVATIELLVTPDLGAGDVVLKPDLGRRRPVDSLSLLRPQAGYVQVGDTMPELKLQWSLQPDATVTAPGAVLLFRDMHPGIASALAAARAERDEQSGFGLWSALVIDPALGQLRFRFADAKEWIDPDSPYYTMSASGTIDRFTRDAFGLLIVFDRENIIRAIIDLGDPDPDLQFEERADPDPEQVSEIRAQITNALE